MGLFSGIIDGIKDIVSYISDTGIDFLGNAIDMFKHEPQHFPDRSQKEVHPEYFDYDSMYDSMYDDYADWINEIWY